MLKRGTRAGGVRRDAEMQRCREQYSTFACGWHYIRFCFFTPVPLSLSLFFFFWLRCVHKLSPPRRPVRGARREFAKRRHAKRNRPPTHSRRKHAGHHPPLVVVLLYRRVSSWRHGGRVFVAPCTKARNLQKWARVLSFSRGSVVALFEVRYVSEAPGLLSKQPSPPLLRPV